MNSELRPKTSKGDIIVHATTLRGCHLWGRRMCTASQPQPQPRSLRSQLWPPMLCCARPWFFTSFSQFHSFRKSLPPPVHTLLPTSSSPYSLLLMRNSFPSQYTVQCSQAWASSIRCWFCQTSYHFWVSISQIRLLHLSYADYYICGVYY